LAWHALRGKYMPLLLSALSKAICDRCHGIQCAFNRVSHGFDYCVAVTSISYNAIACVDEKN
jgi:hypothetical protein